MSRRGGPDPIEANRLNWDERAGIHARDTTGDYMLDAFRAGADALHDIDAREIGDVAGKRVLHLQCHIGRDTLCLARRGARVTGLDFSPAALEVARGLATELGLDATFVLGRIEDAPRVTPGPFDLVYTTWGTINWLPELRSWAQAIATVLAPRGELYFADAHPGFLVLDQKPHGLAPTYDFHTAPDRPLGFRSATTYTGDPTVLTNQQNYEWIHPLSEILGSLLRAGLEVTMFREHEELPWRAVPMLVPASARTWRLPDGHPRLPLSFSLRARKAA